MSKVVKFHRSSKWSAYVEVFKTEMSRSYFTQLCYGSFTLITGITLREGETKFVRVTEVPNASYRLLKKKQKVRRKNSKPGGAGWNGISSCSEAELRT